MIEAAWPTGGRTTARPERSAAQGALARCRTAAWLLVALTCAGGHCEVAVRAAGDATLDTPATAGDLEDEYFARTAEWGGREDARRLGRTILDRLAADPVALDSFAWRILTDESLLHRDHDLALRAARMAFEATEAQDSEVLETYARALYACGRRDEAIAVQRRAIDHCVDDPRTRLILKEVLAEYLEPPPDPGPDDGTIERRLREELVSLVAAGRTPSVRTLLEATDVAPAHVETRAPADRRLTSRELYDHARPSVVVVGTLERSGDDDYTMSLGSGFIVHESGIVVTNFHVIDTVEALGVAVMTADGAVHAVTSLLAVSPLADIAVCRLDGAENLPPLALAAAARPGERLHVIGSPDGAFFSLTEGILSRYFVHRENGQAKTMFTTTADFGVGSSGGPLLDECGNVAGMVASTRAVYAQDDALPVPEESPPGTAADGGEATDAPPDAPQAVTGSDGPASAEGRGDFQMGLNMCVPAADILRLLGGPR